MRACLSVTGCRDEIPGKTKSLGTPKLNLGIPQFGDGTAATNR